MHPTIRLVLLVTGLRAVSSLALPLHVTTEVYERQNGINLGGHLDLNREWCPTIYDDSEGPQLYDNDQEARGDCWFLAAISSVASADNNYLRSILPQPACAEHKEDGTTVLVKLFDGSMKQQELSVKLTLDTFTSRMEIDGFPENDPHWGLANLIWKDWDHTWPAVMEAAALQLSTTDKSISEGLETGTGVLAFSMIYGKQPKWMFLDDPAFDLSIFQNANKWPMYLSTKADAGAGWIGGHAYSILSGNDDTDTVTVRNPWASNPPDDSLNADGDGTFDIPINGDLGSSCLTCGSLNYVAWVEP